MTSETPSGSPGPTPAAPASTTPPAAPASAVAAGRQRSRPSGPGRRGEPAGLVTRGAAYVIDAMVIVVLLSVVTFAIESLQTIVSSYDTAVELPWRAGGGLITVTAVTVLVVGTTYFTLGWWLFGRTVGKLVLGVRVVNARGQRPGFRQSLVRAFGYLLSSVFLLGFLWIGLTPRRRGWHDHLARTWVVYDWAAHRRQYYDDDPLPPRA